MKYLENDNFVLMFIGFNKKTDSCFRELWKQMDRKEKSKKKNKEMVKVLSSFNNNCKKDNVIDLNVFSEEMDDYDD